MNKNRKYWNIFEILPYQRCFNFINGERSIGKSYTTQKFFIDQFFKKKYEFVYIVRTQDEKKRGILAQAYKKVISKEFKEHEDNIKITNETMFFQIKDGDVVKEEITMGYCLALSEVVKIKKRSFPKVKYLLFDEYMLEKKQGGQYVNGWKEPDLFLSIYHTIDREQDKVVCFLLGNNTSFYNPYHMHKAFRIPNIQKGGLWKSENVLFQWAEGNRILKEEKEKCKFLKMIDSTEYGRYAKDGEYIDDNDCFLMKLTKSAYYYMTIEFESMKFGIFNDLRNGVIFVSDKVDYNCKFVYALTLSDHSENTMLTTGRGLTQLNWFSSNFKLGNVRFTDMEVKTKFQGALDLLIK